MATEERTARWEADYGKHFPLLVGIAMKKFRVPPEDAELLAQDVFLSYLQSTATIEDLRRWLIGAICNSSRKYWLNRGRREDLSEDYSNESAPTSAVDEMHNRVAARQALSQVGGKYREAIYLRYLEGCTIPEIAARLRTTPGYAEKLVRVGLERIRSKGES
jgi:RNA polymerase sigma factor (sigma-70 family)